MKMNVKILKLAIPYILVNLSFPLVGLVDTWIVSHLNSEVNEVSLAALALASTFFTSLYWVFSFLKMGTTGFSAKAFGANDFKLQLFVLLRGILIAVIIGVLIWCVQGGFKRVLLFGFNTDEEVFLKIFDYFDVRIWAAPVTLCVYVFQGWFLGMQKINTAMLGLFVLNISNMLFSMYFGSYLNLGVEGVALGTLLSQVLTWFYFVISFGLRYSKLLSWWNRKDFLKLTDFYEMMRVNRHLLFRTLSLMLVLTAFNTLSANYGVESLAAIAILFPLWLMASYGIDGFATAAEVLSGEAVGRKDKVVLKKVIRYSLLWGLLLSIVLSFILLLTQSWILSLFTSDVSILKKCEKWMIWIVCCPLINFVAFIWDGVFLGVLDTEPLQNTMIFAAFFVFFPCYFLFEEFLAMDSLWLALAAFMVARGIGLTIIYFKRQRYWIG